MIATLYGVGNHVTRMNESCHTYERVMSHVWMSHVTRMNESCQTYERVMSHVWMSHVTRMNESCHTYERVMSRKWTSYVRLVDESCHAHVVMSHVTHMNEWNWLCNVSLLCMGVVNRDTRMNESCHTYEWVMSHDEWVISCISMNHVTHMNAQKRLNNVSYSMEVMGHVTHMNESGHTYEWVKSHTWMNDTDYAMYPYSVWGSWVVTHVWMRHVTRMNESRHTYEWVMSHTCMNE